MATAISSRSSAVASGSAVSGKTASQRSPSLSGRLYPRGQLAVGGRDERFVDRVHSTRLEETRRPAVVGRQQALAAVVSRAGHHAGGEARAAPPAAEDHAVAHAPLLPGPARASPPAWHHHTTRRGRMFDRIVPSRRDPSASALAPKERFRAFRRRFRAGNNMRIRVSGRTAWPARRRSGRLCGSTGTARPPPSPPRPSGRRRPPVWVHRVAHPIAERPVVAAA